MIAERLEERLETLGWTAADLAREVGVTKVTVQRWLRGVVEPRASMLVPVARALGVSVGWLVGDEGLKTRPSESRFKA